MNNFIILSEEKIKIMSDDPSSSKKNWLSRLKLDRKKITIEYWQNALNELVDDGSVAASSAKMIQAILRSQTLTVRDIMVPRAKMVTISIDDPFDEAFDRIIQSGHSRIPVLLEDHEEMMGLLLTKDLLKKINEPALSISQLLRPIVYVPEGKYVTALLNEFREQHFHLALVVDEYGAVTGLVTIEDILEQIVGEIDDEHDIVIKEEVPDVEQLDEDHYIVDALMPLEEFNERFKTNFETDEVETIGGLIMTRCGSLPKESDIVVVDAFRFTVMPYDGKVLSHLEMEINHGIDDQG